MANSFAPVASAPTDAQSNPSTEPFHNSTTFPQRQSAEAGSRVESDTTLYDGTNSANETERRTLDAKAAEKGSGDRPTLAARKFDTEIARPVVQRLPAPARRHQSTIDTSIYGRGATLRSDSEGWSSDEEYHPKLRKSWTQPDHLLSKAHLNGVRTNPRRLHLRVGNEFFQSRCGLAKDGRLNISVSEKANTGYLAKALGATFERHLSSLQGQEEAVVAASLEEKAKADFREAKPHLQIPRMNIVIMVIGSRGDIQPFLKIGKILKDKYHHRVRIATHPTFKKFVEEETGLEFFSVGGDPSELMAFMVKNPGLIPSLETLKSGELGRRRESMFQMFQGFWRACINATDDETDRANLEMMGSKPPFVADAIIANPPSFAHYHCAERLSIPLHLVFTFPYSPTQAFPHPLANIKATNVDQSYTNFMSYPLIDLMTWQGLGDLINRFRVHTLGLEPVSTLWAPGQLSRLKVPITYLWSPGLVPKPRDWGPEIDIAGYVFLDLASSYKPPQDLAQFLERTDERPIVYVGFGSISGIDDPVAFTKMIYEGIEKAGVRAVISRGWGRMGDGIEKPDGVFMVDNVPHDWLFPKVDAVVHHGGAGTTAAGLRFGKPTMIVPFFGDQPFWSAMVAKAGAGAKQALPWKKLSSDSFAEGIRQCLAPEARAKAEEIAKSIEKEGDGAENAVDSFHRALDLDGEHSVRCRLFVDRVAVWKVQRHAIQLSALAADLLVENKELHWSDLELNRIREWTDFQGPGEPITGAGGVLVQAFQEAFYGLATMHESTKKDIKHYEKHRRRHKTKSTKDALVLPGRIAYAIRGTSTDMQKKERARLENELNLQGEAEPVRLPFAPSDPDNEPSAGGGGLNRIMTDMSDEPSARVILKDVGRGVGHSTRVIVSLPMQIWNALALGFHNAPRLYGDKTVRPSPARITGFRAGVKAAGTEFFLGFYDGVTGMVRIPYLEVHEEGMVGFPIGVAKGFGGLVLKPISGILGLGAYTFKGAHYSLRRRLRDTEKTDRWIRRARIAQGQREVEEFKVPANNTRAPRPYVRPTPEYDEVRNQALRLWTKYEKELILSESRQKEARTLLLRKARRESHSPRTQGDIHGDTAT
ncbi:hypothetical protein A1O3_01551 [Capronia epimyces CBS 606.96]|uniref:Uncharacterized protein n=1 Tax=Capronia epimyces CBS 606.96 TaxID=1182542 RepID=W9YTK0_9EURO|nr:uncharacterized protein A1O3_01551 [Capronia epimyces CBS 606.96]EXJ92995.1 hypothetical protein A1O3_01551 [Capronia epimyces CBS 606.96]